MRKFLIYALFCALISILSTCRKKTNIDVLVYNYALSEPISNAEVVLVEKHINIWGKTSCEEIAKSTTDQNGECRFSKEKLRKGKNYDYYLAVASAYGISQTYPCEGKASGFLDKGTSQNVTLEASAFDAFFKVKYNNLLNPSQPGDSLVVVINNPTYWIPGEPSPYLGGGVFYGSPYFGANGFPFPNPVITSVKKTDAGKNILRIHKRKMGIVTNTVDTIKIYPGETKIIEINW